MSERQTRIIITFKEKEQTDQAETGQRDPAGKASVGGVSSSKQYSKYPPQHPHLHRKPWDVARMFPDDHRFEYKVQVSDRKLAKKGGA